MFKLFKSKPEITPDLTKLTYGDIVTLNSSGQYVKMQKFEVKQTLWERLLRKPKKHRYNGPVMGMVSQVNPLEVSNQASFTWVK